MALQRVVALVEELLQRDGEVLHAIAVACIRQRHAIDQTKTQHVTVDQCYTIPSHERQWSLYA